MWENNLGTHLGLSKTSGKFGVEIEMELDKSCSPKLLNSIEMPNSKTSKSIWSVKTDGSLKKNGIECVMREPCPSLEKVEESVNHILQCLKQDSNTITDSMRAAVHVHYNMQEKTIAELAMFLMVYYPIESILTKFCGESREGNLFCLRLRDAEYSIYLLNHFVLENDIYCFRNDSIRYSALNLKSLFNFGSVEFRALRTKSSLDNIVTWCGIIEKIDKYSLSVKNPWSVLEKISGMGTENYLSEIFGEELTKTLSYPDMDRDVFYDTRNLQFFAESLRTKICK